MSKQAVKKSVRQLAGPGIVGSEQDTPLFHFDVERRDVDNLVADPVAFLKGIGLGARQGIAPRNVMQVNLGLPGQAWDGDEWVDAGVDGATSTWCCYVVGDTTTCHEH